MALDAGVLSDIADAKVAVAVAGALVVGVMVARQAVWWVRMVIDQRQLDREYIEYEEARSRQLDAEARNRRH